MSAAYDRAASEESGPDLDEELAGCSLCDGIAVEGGDLCGRCVAYQAAREAPCSSGCGQRVGNGREGKCSVCIALEEQAERERQSAQRHAAMMLEYERSPYACPGCGCKMLRPSTCGECDQRTRAARDLQELLTGWLPAAYRDWPDFAALEALSTRVRNPSGVERARSACSATTWCTTIVGPAAAGKTHLAIAVAKAHVLSRRRHAEYACARDLAFARSRSPLGDEPTIVRDALAASILLLDDLDLAPEVHGSAVVDVIHGRHRDGKLTIVTSTIGVQETAARHGDGTARRLFERGVATVIELRAPKAGAR